MNAIRERLADDELSIGDYVLTNGALPAMVVVDAVTRCCRACWAMTKARATNLSVTACWNIRNTRGRRNFAGMKVPDVLLSGNHAEIDKWRANRRTQD